METKISENWDLDSLYKGGKASTKLEETILQLKDELVVLQKELHTYKGLEDGGDLVEYLIKVQEYKLAAFELDEFLICLYSVNVNDPDVSKLIEESSTLKAGLESLLIDVDQVLANLSYSQWHALMQHKEIQKVQFYLEERKQRVANKLPLEIEKIINALSVNGFIGWEDHYEQLMGELRFTVEKDGELEEMSIGQALSYAAFSSNPSIRQKTGQVVVKGLAEKADSFASILNRIIGFRLDVYKQRGWNNVLKESMEQNRVNETSVHAMLSSIKENREIAHTFYKRKAQVMKIDKLAWYDTESPSFHSSKIIPYDEAAKIVINQFYQFSEKLGQFAERAFHEGWIEAEDRKGKMHGGFCAYMPIKKESRIFLTYTGSYQDIVTIAHELGHAYHNFILQDEPAFAQEVSTSMAETASTFAENLVLDAAIAQAQTLEEKLFLLETKILNGLKYQVMVPGMFEFEQKLYELRKRGSITAEDISGIMANMFKEFYGEALAENNPYLWMTIPQIFSTELAFYNIPYTIGYLFSNGIYAQAKEQGESFLEQYDSLLQNTGKMNVETLAATYLNQDLGERKFWDASLQPTIEAIHEYLRLTEEFI
ncbi:M3 family oligoendopeptidase [Mesobacillus maritimus]|uniref:M3 family oligoendopeptidase n=1 Tax=Mesobacillus maritimus TaxID=1643336 RepID=A0ABS7KBR6_9BACI|nr:M3 family oligoendopeptidase [Mesobacillus maritimus]MBY0099704.1 M3 family oligoendopeptidase [Mesobacillus maritimus]